MNILESGLVIPGLLGQLKPGQLFSHTGRDLHMVSTMQERELNKPCRGLDYTHTVNLHTGLLSKLSTDMPILHLNTSLELSHTVQLTTSTKEPT